MTPDVNVLLAAARPDHVHHRSARQWFAAMAGIEAQPLLLFPMVVISFLRLVVNPRVFPQPALPGEALAFVDAMLSAPSARMPPLGSEWPIFGAMALATKPLKSNAIPDLWLAAAVREHGDHLVTFDTGFRRMLKRTELTVLT